MVYKALLVGINYYMQKADALKSPLENIELYKDFLISYAHFKPDNIILLSDSPNYGNATFFSITTELKRLLKDSNKNDFIILYFSGYGNFLGKLDENSDKYAQEKMKNISIYKEVDNKTLFLPQDFHISTLTNEYFYTILNKSNSRIFLMFDCFNKHSRLKLKNYYDINNKTYNKHIKDFDKWENNIICLSSNTTEKNYFHKYFRVNFINNKIKKFYSHFTIYFLKAMVDYLQINVNFTTYTYESMYETLVNIQNDNRLDFTNIEPLEQDEQKKTSDCCCNKEKNYLYLAFSKENLLKNNFLDTRIKEEKDEVEKNELINKKLILRDKTLAYKNVELERTIKILKKRNNHIKNELTLINKKLNGRLRNFSLMNFN
jgi:hypothetical protein